MNNRPSGARQRFLGIYTQLFKKLNNVEFVIFEPKDCEISPWFSKQPNISFRNTPIPSTGRLGKFSTGLNYWNQAFKKERFDIFEAMHLPMVCPKDSASILTIHDVRGLYIDPLLPSSLLFKRVLYNALKRSDHVITVSETMKEQLLSFFSNIKISVINNGIDPGLFSIPSEEECNSFQKRYNLPDDFAISVGHLEPRKNYSKLIDAIGILNSRGLKCPLLIIGNDSGEGKSLIKKINKMNLQNQIFLLQGLTDLEVRCAYAKCNLFIFPSKYEGFGIPILECMATKRPMVLSDLPVFKEITEGHALYFDPTNVDAMVNAIEIGLTCNKTGQKIINYSEKRIQDFSFEKLAVQAAEIYTEYDK